jgi:putative ABC transport system permease protein
VRFGQAEWQVVGTFEAGGGVSESELWTDVRVLQPAYRRGNTFQSVRVRLESPEALAQLDAALEADPRIDVDVERETDYYAAQSEALTRFIKSIGYPLSILMAIGAVFGALNTMYSSVAARTREIATLRALGFGASPVAVSTLVESLLLALIGGIIGAAITWVVFNGYTVSTLNGATFSQVVFAFAVTPALLAQGLVAALVIGLLGGLLPGLRAARLPRPCAEVVCRRQRACGGWPACRPRPRAPGPLRPPVPAGRRAGSPSARRGAARRRSRRSCRRTCARRS